MQTGVTELLINWFPMLFMGALWIVTLVVAGRVILALRHRRDT
jgi:hypothetical protein